MSRFCIFGAGAIGSHIAARLAMVGQSVSVVARGDQLKAIAEKGIILQAHGKTTHTRVQASDNPLDLGTQDVVFVTVKAPALPEAAKAWGPLLGPETAVVFVMNGIPWWYIRSLEATHAIGAAVPKSIASIAEKISLEQVIGGVILSPAQVTSPGQVEVQGATSRLTLGELDGSTTDRIRGISDALTAGGLETIVTGNIREAVWDKLVTNLMTGPMAVLSRATYKEILADPSCRRAAVSIVDEISAVARAFGCNVPADAEKRLALVENISHRPSILQDLLLSRAMEIETLIDYPLALARIAGIDVPTFDLLASLSRVSAQSAGLCNRD